MRELNDDEKDFVENTLKSRKTTTENKSSKTTNKNKVKRTKSKPTPPWARLSNWAAAVMIIPFIITGIFFYYLYKIKNYLGEGGFSFLVEEELPPDFTETAKSYGMSWLTDFIQIYQNKEIIIGGLFAVTIVIVALMMILDVILEKKKAMKEGVENE